MTYDPHEAPGQGITSGSLLETIYSWQAGKAPREAVVGLLGALGPEYGDLVQETVQELTHWVNAAPTPGAGKSVPAAQGDTDAWRSELMACRARAWAFPHSAGMLVSDAILILTDGQRGVILYPDHIRALPASTSGSMMLLCQTIVMAQNAVDAKEVGQLRQQRIDSASTSLSEIEPIH
ncbi:hypothetical protein [Deinococcus sp.]|uniref:hypothetical protein n=1 Tax=Deinococcus sp. TaxID=47478 RepID=UPI0025BE65FA|nr:hypothetical protein [Deinococcus sp.]